MHPRTTSLSAGLLALAALAAAAPRAAAQPTAPATPDTPDWPTLTDPYAYTVQVQPRAWYVSPAGKLTLPSSTPAAGGNIRLNDLNLDQPRVSPFGEISLKADEWRFTLSGANYEITHDATAPFAFTLGSTPVAGGAAFRMNFDYAMFGANVGYRFYTHDFGKQGGGTPDAYVLRLEAVGGLRLHDLDIRITNALGATSGTDQFYGELIAGARAELQLARDFSIDLELTGGGLPGEDHTVYSLDVAVGFTWRVLDGVGAQIGWRQLAVSLEDDAGPRQFKYVGTLAGLFAGVVIRF